MDSLSADNDRDTDTFHGFAITLFRVNIMQILWMLDAGWLMNMPIIITSYVKLMMIGWMLDIVNLVMIMIIIMTTWMFNV